jgi:hypothetical protein
MKTSTKKATLISRRFSNEATGLILSLGVMLSGCGQVSDLVDSTTAQSGTFSHVYSNVLSDCLQCHDGSNAADYGALDFSSKAKAYESLQGTVSGPLASGTCAGVELITASAPADSYFAAVLLSEFATTSGIAGDSDCVPYANHLEDQNLTTAEKTSIKDWITAGALNN